MSSNLQKLQAATFKIRVELYFFFFFFVDCMEYQFHPREYQFHPATSIYMAQFYSL